MIASVPSPPLLLPGATGGRVAEVEQLRDACVAAVAELLADGPAEITVIGAVRPAWTGGRPLAELVGAGLLADAGCTVASQFVAVEPEAGPQRCLQAGRALAGRPLLVVADGSARRGLKAPGYLDERAAPFDAELLAALQAGDPARLADLDPDRAAQLMVAGRAVWQVMAGATEGRSWQTHTHYADDPFGVFYPVVSWR
ncbi:MAG TPA: hypothetical protein VHO01_07755 [Jatrophihabitans sp.]|nr:hypothetical protein [Jatrophihabitans sp.]